MIVTPILSEVENHKIRKEEAMTIAKKLSKINLILGNVPLAKEKMLDLKEDKQTLAALSGTTFLL